LLRRLPSTLTNSLIFIHPHLKLLQQFTDHVKKTDLFHAKDRLLVAVSGGIDSVVLCHLCKEAGYTFTIAHCNFCLRGAESERDQEFVQELAKSLNVPFLVKQFGTSTYAAEHKVSIQVAARELRYSWFYQILDHSQTKPESPPNVHESLHYILTAHHLDDNIETVLMNFLKGTGISGLRGIEPKQNRLVRPLLFAAKEDITRYAHENNFEWVNDSSNDKTDYTRNLFRHKIIPQIAGIYPAVKQNLAHNIERFTDAEILYNSAIARHKKDLLEHRGEEIFIPVLKLGKSVPLHTIIFETVKDFGFSAHQVAEVVKLLSSESGKFIQSNTHRILRNRAWLIISPLKEAEQQIILIEENDIEKVFDGRVLIIEHVQKDEIPITIERSEASLDSKNITFPLMLRGGNKAIIFTRWAW